MDRAEIVAVIAAHAAWQRDRNTGARANLSGAALSRADLRGANLDYADLCRANLSDADLRGANLDYAAWPLWCGSLNVTLDERQQAQLLYHVLAVSPAALSLATPEMLAFANGSHVVRSHGQPKLTASQPEAQP